MTMENIEARQNLFAPFSHGGLDSLLSNLTLFLSPQLSSLVLLFATVNKRAGGYSVVTDLELSWLPAPSCLDPHDEPRNGPIRDPGVW